MNSHATRSFIAGRPVEWRVSRQRNYGGRNGSNKKRPRLALWRPRYLRVEGRGVPKMSYRSERSRRIAQRAK